MKVSHLAATVLTLGGLATTVVPMHAQKSPTLPELLQSAATYLAAYSTQMGAVAAEENMLQRETTGGQLGPASTWKADYVLLGLANGSLAGFRDTVETEHNKIPGHGDQLLKLLRDAPNGALIDAQNLTSASLRYAMAGAMATFNMPALALEFLRADNQARSTFKLDSVKTTNGAQVAQLRFAEQTKPRIISGTDDGTVDGRFQIDVASGAVRQSELLLGTKSLSVRVVVTYVKDPKLGLWLPASMDGSYEMMAGGSGSATVLGKGTDNNAYATHQTIECHVTYTKFQQTPVDLGKLAK